MRRRLLLSALLLGAGAAAATAVLGVQARGVRADLTAAERLAEEVAEEVRDTAAPDLRPLQRRTNAAAQTTDGLLWRAASYLPVVGQDVRAVRRVARAATDLSDRAAPALVEAVRLVEGDSTAAGALLRDGGVDLTRLDTIKDHVTQAQRVTAATRRELRPGGHATVRREAQRLQDKVVELDDALTTATRTLAQAPAMLGATQQRRYLVAVQNNAEARATGGLVGIVAVVRADRGRLELEKTVTNDALVNATRPVPSDPAAAKTWTGVGSTVAWFDANLTPHVPDAARNLAGLWRAQHRERVDGVVLLDAVSLGQLLARPVTLGTTTLRPDEVVDWVARREYVEHPDVAARKALLRQLAEAIFDQTTALRTAQPLLDAARSGHLFVWSARAQEQALLADHLIGGALPADGSPYLQVVTQNFGGNKLDYYLRRRVQVRRDGDAYAVTVTLTNTAPRGLPDYMTVRSDHPAGRVGYAQARIGLSLYAGRGARFERWVADRRALLVRFDTDHGLTLGTTILELPRGASVTVTTRVHMAAGELVYRQQPLVRADNLDLQVPHRLVGS